MPRITAGSVAAHRAAIRERILTAVERLASCRGVEHLSFTDVAAEAGITRSVVYNYFPDREALLIAYAQRETERFLEVFTPLSARIPTATGKLTLYLRLHLAHHASPARPSYPALAALLDSEGHPRVRAHAEPLTQTLRSVLAEGVTTGEFAPCDPVATAVLVHACLGAERVRLARGGHDVTDTVERVTAFVLRGLGAAEHH